VDLAHQFGEVVRRIGGECLEIGQRPIALEDLGQQAVAPVEEAVQCG
jgi:hypothetical protein